MDGLNESTESAIERWYSRDFDQETRMELDALLAAQGAEELNQRFSQRLSFGTAGLRAKVGVGTNRINALVIQETSLGLGRYLLSAVPQAQSRGVVVGYDARTHSKAFADVAADAFASLGLKVYLANRPMATPINAFALTHFGAAAGVVVTASHNPPEYNGYKVFWGNGAQIIPPHDSKIASAIEEVAQADLATLLGSASTKTTRGNIESFGQELVDTYMQAIEAIDWWQPGAEDCAALSIAYSPMHGVGWRDISTIAERFGFSNLQCEPSQQEPDGSFPTVSFPNPEEPGAMDRLMATAASSGADICVANDPDADRLAVAVRSDSAAGGFAMLSGNDIGALLGWRCIQHAKASGTEIGVATTVVSSPLLQNIAKAEGVDYANTLTGFKWLANHGIDWENGHGGKPFGFGYEEAIGFGVGNKVRDKDGLSAFIGIAKLAAEEKATGSNLLERLEAIKAKYGQFSSAQKSVWFEDDANASAASKMTATMQSWRSNPPDAIGGYKVTSVDDYDDAERKLAPATTNMLVYHLEGSGELADKTVRIIMRPSGTEPKLKSYYDVETSNSDLLNALIDAHQAQLSKSS